jgi:heptaprenyl diphosphate synthase
MTTKRMVLLSALAALSVVLNWIENMIFPWAVLPIPGVKLGLANLVFLIILVVDTMGTALAVSLIRVVMVSLFTGTIASPVFPLSLGGAALSICLMQTVRVVFGRRLSIIGVSICGAVGHNLGQLLVLMLLPGLFPGLASVYLLLPGLLLMSVATGIATGWVARQVLPAVEREWRT